MSDTITFNNCFIINADNDPTIEAVADDLVEIVAEQETEIAALRAEVEELNDELGTMDEQEVRLRGEIADLRELLGKLLGHGMRPAKGGIIQEVKAEGFLTRQDEVASTADLKKAATAISLDGEQETEIAALTRENQQLADRNANQKLIIEHQVKELRDLRQELSTVKNGREVLAKQVDDLEDRILPDIDTRDAPPNLNHL